MQLQKKCKKYHSKIQKRKQKPGHYESLLVVTYSKAQWNNQTNDMNHWLDEFSDVFIRDLETNQTKMEETQPATVKTTNTSRKKD